jgi:signal transduction histidine kinase
MTYVGEAGARRGGWADRRRRIAVAPRGPAVAGALLGLLAVTELAVRYELDRGSIVRLAMARSFAGAASGGLVLCLLCLSATLPLAFRRPAAAAMAVSVGAMLSLTVLHMLTVAGVGAQLIAGYRLGRSDTQLLAVVLGVPFLVLALAGSPDSGVRVLTVLLASLVPASAVAGIARRSRGEARENTAARQVIAGTLLEHTARGERARIARELHDVVAHHISLVAVQAETARLTTAGMSADGAKRLRAIGDTARAALTEMRRLLGVLREDAQTGAPDRRPQPGLRQLNELLDEARDASGAGARLIISGPPLTLDPGVELAAYRIVQEALTNSRRHAPGAAIDVELQFGGDGLRVRIRDNGPGPLPAAPAGGHGLLGMRERAAAVGGELRAGAAPGGGFLVEAELPGTAEPQGEAQLPEAQLPEAQLPEAQLREAQLRGKAG